MSYGEGARCKLCIFSRSPKLGGVKTRLARDIGDEQALSAHISLVERCLEQVTGIEGFDVELWIDGSLSNPLVQSWVSAWSLVLRRQGIGDLGLKMSLAAREALQSSDSVIIIGTDCPPIDSSYLRKANNYLEIYDLVLGPAQDGGYGLIGFKRYFPELFMDIPWGTQHVFRSTLSKAKKLGLKIQVLETIWDVDILKDWKRFLELLS